MVLNEADNKTSLSARQTENVALRDGVASSNLAFLINTLLQRGEDDLEENS